MDGLRVISHATVLASACLVAALAASAGRTADGGRSSEQLELADGSRLPYALVLPDGYDPEISYPVLIALPPGDQSARMVVSALDQYWEDEARRRGWIVASPSAIDGRMFWNGAEQRIVELARHLLETMRVEGGRVHVAGISNGGRSAFSSALASPESFASLTVLPGVVEKNSDLDRLAVLKDVDVSMFVGERDTDWVKATQQIAGALRDAGVSVSVTIVPGENHVLTEAVRSIIFDRLDRLRLQVSGD